MLSFSTEFELTRKLKLEPFICPPSAWQGKHSELFSQHIHGLLRLNSVALAMHLLKHSYDLNKM